ncbi:hypothetical protein LEP1GSC059_4523 [Leptospira noguchii serovar Panama str. CZ214]|uniref:Uncharacterized protein n=1 Tax=Leptospira noguchii serovar Panama str. CZ214 TaxID=1001595 RepID=T0FM71_9LEPT|nr:hypothetical protein LEP1GSC059_4523 [Leptospira noguchii serovar Panama str. CZ214]
MCSIGGSFILDDFIDCPKEIRVRVTMTKNHLNLSRREKL